MRLTKEDIRLMTLEERMELIDTIWEVTDEEHPEWIDQRSEDEILAGQEEVENEAGNIQTSQN